MTVGLGGYVPLVNDDTPDMSDPTMRLLDLLRLQPFWVARLPKDVILLEDERLCFIREGIPCHRLARIVEAIWDDMWAPVRDDVIDRCVAQMLTAAPAPRTT